MTSYDLLPFAFQLRFVMIYGDYQVEKTIGSFKSLRSAKAKSRYGSVLIESNLDKSKLRMFWIIEHDIGIPEKVVTYVKEVHPDKETHWIKLDQVLLNLLKRRRPGIHGRYFRL